MSVGTQPEPKEDREEEQELRGQMSFLDHLEELRQRILRSLIAVGAGFGLCFGFYSNQLFVIGGLFGYFIAFPFAVQFLIGIGTGMKMMPVINAAEYFDLFLTVMICLGIVFQIPAIIFILARIGLVTGSFLLRNARYA